MLNKKIRYTDFNGVKQERNFHFHMTKKQLQDFLIELGLDATTNVDVHFENLMQEGKILQVVQFFDEFVLRAVGKLSPDGQSFVKSQETREAFEFSPAYDELRKMYGSKEPSEGIVEFLIKTMPAEDGDALRASIKKQQEAQAAKQKELLAIESETSAADTQTSV